MVEPDFLLGMEGLGLKIEWHLRDKNLIFDLDFLARMKGLGLKIEFHLWNQRLFLDLGFLFWHGIFGLHRLGWKLRFLLDRFLRFAEFSLASFTDPPFLLDGQIMRVSAIIPITAISIFLLEMANCRKFLLDLGWRFFDHSLDS